jgi:hypothetical protein
MESLSEFYYWGWLISSTILLTILMAQANDERA